MKMGCAHNLMEDKIVCQMCASVCVCAKSVESCLAQCGPMDCIHQAPLSMGFSRQEYWSGLPFPPPGDLSDPGKIKLPVLGLLHEQVASLPLLPPGSPNYVCKYC